MAMYADDTVVFSANVDYCKTVSNLQADINALNTWCKNNGIMANTDKTKIMVFGSTNMLNKTPPPVIGMDNVPLQVVTAYRYLGVTLDNQLSYNSHVDKLIGTVTAKLKQFQRMRSFLNTRAALMVYKNMMLPMLEYGDVFLTATTCVNRKRLQTLQNKGLRCALNKGIETSTDDLHGEANLLKLVYRREQHLLNFMFDLAQIPTMCQTRASGQVSTRSSKKKLMRVKRPYTQKFKKSLTYQGPKRWNALPEVFHHTQTKFAYKALVGNHISRKSMSSNQRFVELN